MHLLADKFLPLSLSLPSLHNSHNQTTENVDFEQWQTRRLGFDLERQVYDLLRQLKCLPWWESYYQDRCVLCACVVLVCLWNARTACCPTTHVLPCCNTQLHGVLSCRVLAPLIHLSPLLTPCYTHAHNLYPHCYNLYSHTTLQG